MTDFHFKTPKEDRIPPGIRKAINRIGPGRYCDPATGRIYIDSADMDDEWDELVDEGQSRTQEIERERGQGPDDEYLRLSEQRMAEVVEQVQTRNASRIEVELHQERVAMLEGRLRTVRAAQTWRATQGFEPDPEHADEISALEEEIRYVREAEEEGAVEEEGVQEEEVEPRAHGVVERPS